MKSNAFSKVGIITITHTFINTTISSQFQFQDINRRSVEGIETYPKEKNDYSAIVSLQQCR